MRVDFPYSRLLEADFALPCWLALNRAVGNLYHLFAHRHLVDHTIAWWIGWKSPCWMLWILLGVLVDGCFIVSCLHVRSRLYSPCSWFLPRLRFFVVRCLWCGGIFLLYTRLGYTHFCYREKVAYLLYKNYEKTKSARSKGRAKPSTVLETTRAVTETPLIAYFTLMTSFH